MRYLLLLNGVLSAPFDQLAGRDGVLTRVAIGDDGPMGRPWLVRWLRSVAPDTLPGEQGPITVVLML